MNTPDISDLYYSLPVIVDFNAYGKKDLVFGKIETVNCLNDNSKIREVLSTDGSNRILIVDGHASKEVALMGDKVAGIAKETFDNTRGGDFDERDILATTLGGIAVSVTIPLFRKKRKQ